MRDFAKSVYSTLRKSVTNMPADFISPILAKFNRVILLTWFRVPGGVIGVPFDRFLREMCLYKQAVRSTGCDYENRNVHSGNVNF